MPAAVGVVLDAGNDAGLDGVLMDVTEEGGEAGDRGQVPVPILKISVLHTYSLILF